MLADAGLAVAYDVKLSTLFVLFQPAEACGDKYQILAESQQKPSVLFG